MPKDRAEAEARIVFLYVSGQIPVSVRGDKVWGDPGLLEAQVGKQDWADTGWFQTQAVQNGLGSQEGRGSPGWLGVGFSFGGI